MDDRKKKAFDFIADITKQLITLVTAVIGGLITFGNSGLAVKASGVLVYALGIYAASGIFGALTLMAVTGQLGSPSVTDAACSPYAPNIRLFSGLQIVSFLVATGLFAYATIIYINQK